MEKYSKEIVIVFNIWNYKGFGFRKEWWIWNFMKEVIRFSDWLYIERKRENFKMLIRFWILRKIKRGV